jgi:hypothetical protein
MNTIFPSSIFLWMTRLLSASRHSFPFCLHHVDPAGQNGTGQPNTAGNVYFPFPVDRPCYFSYHAQENKTVNFIGWQI